AVADPHPGVRCHAIRLCEPHLARLGDSPELGSALVKLITDPDAQVRMQLAYTLGEWDDPRAGTALGRLALRHAADRYLPAAVPSWLTRKNLDGVLLAVLKGSQTPPPPADLLAHLLRMADALGNTRVTVTILNAVATPAGRSKGKYASWQFAALAGLLDRLDQRNTALAKLHAEADQELRAALKRPRGLFAAPRARVANPKAPRHAQL